MAAELFLISIPIPGKAKEFESTEKKMRYSHGQTHTGDTYPYHQCQKDSYWCYTCPSVLPLVDYVTKICCTQ